MSKPGRRADPVLDPLFERSRKIGPVSDVAYARALAGARARVAEAAPAPTTPAVSGRTQPAKIAMATSAGLLLVVSGAAAALLGRTLVTPRVSPPRAEERAPTIAAFAENSRVVQGVDEQSASGPTPRRHPRALTARESRTAEMVIIQRAQAAYADGNDPAVLELVAQHGRRFPTGRLAEEREALRVRALVRCGRHDEATRAATAFAHRFPDSVLLSSLKQTVAGGQ